MYFLHRVRPDIQIVAINNLQELTDEFWQHYFLHFDEGIVLTPKHKHEVSYIGGGCPPIETEHGWLLIYHGVHDTIKGYVYSACAALLDLQNPQKEIARLPYALFKPEYDWELAGRSEQRLFPYRYCFIRTIPYIYIMALPTSKLPVLLVSISALLKELILNKKNDKIKSL